MQRYLGIDLGTTNSTVSVANVTFRSDIEPKTLEVQQVDESGNNFVMDTSLPSVLYVDEQKIHFVGQFARKMLGVYPKRVLRETKRYIGTEANWPIDDETYRPEDIASFVLKKLKTQAEEYYGNEKIDSVVITVPANFNPQQDKATRTAAELAGFDKNKIHTIPEPTAALIDFLNEERKLAAESRRIQFHGKPKNLLVFDLGGGTCDVSILQVMEGGDGEMHIQEMSISQYMELGGMNFDKKVADVLLQRLLKEKNIPPATLRQKFNEQELAKLWEGLLDMAEKSKKFFSTRIKSTLDNEQISYFEHKSRFDSLNFQLMLNTVPEELMTLVSITKKEYDEIVGDLLYKEKSKNGINIEEPILNALSNAKQGAMRKEDIDAVFLVGGMTFYQTIQDRIYEIFDRRIKPLNSVNPMNAVSRGASVFHYHINKIFLNSDGQKQSADETLLKPDMTLGLTVSSNVYIDVTEGNPVPLLEKGTKVPYERIFDQDEFFVRGAFGKTTVNMMQLKLFTAPGPISIHRKDLKSATITFKKPVLVNSSLVLKVSCNEERDVTVTAWLKEDETETIDVNIGAREYTLEQIEAIRKKHEDINKIR